jgi:hypothetical protein
MDKPRFLQSKLKASFRAMTRRTDAAFPPAHPKQKHEVKVVKWTSRVAHRKDEDGRYENLQQDTQAS